MSTVVKARVADISDNVVSAAEQLTMPVTVTFCYVPSGGSLTAINTSMQVYISGTNLLTGLLIDDTIRSAVKDFVHTNWSISQISQTVLLSGGFNLPLL